MAEKEPIKADKKDDQEFERLSDEEKIESLIASLEKETPKKEKKPTPKKEPLKPKEPVPSKRTQFKNRMIMIKFGGAYHPNFYLNLVITYWVNLVLVVGLLNVFNLGRFPDQIWIPMVFVLMYTGFEFLFREWMVQKFSQWVLLSFGLIYFVGYSTLFFIIDVLFFTNIQVFNSEIELVAFTGLFMIARYLISWVIKKGLDWRR